MKGLWLVLLFVFILVSYTQEPNLQNQTINISHNPTNIDKEKDVLVVRAYDGKFPIIKLDEKHLSILRGGCEEEKQWVILEPSVIKGRGALIRAVYAVEYPENCSNVAFLGKNYRLLLACSDDECSEVLKTPNGDPIIINDRAVFKDSKWRITKDVNDKGIRNVEVYMLGYFFDIADRYELELFGTKGFVLRFENTEDGPVLVIEATDVKRDKPSPYSFVFTIDDTANKKNYVGREIFDDGVRIVLSTPLPAMDGIQGDKKLRPLEIPLGNSTYVITCLYYNNTTSKLCLGKERKRLMLNPVGCTRPGYLTVNGKKYGFEGTTVFVNESADKIRVVMCEIDEGMCSENKMETKMGERIGAEDEMALIWNISLEQSWCSKSIEASELYREVELEDGKDGVVIDWVDGGLKGIYISAESPAYIKLMEN